MDEKIYMKMGGLLYTSNDDRRLAENILLTQEQ